MITEKSRGRLPPYVSYRTFRNFIEGLQQRVPSRIDRSYWGDTLSGSTGTQLMAALKFLGLIDARGQPMPRLKPLVSTKGEQRAELLREILSDATYSQLDEIFHDTFQLTDDVRRKCVKFFVELATEAGVPLSPFITKRFRSTHSNAGIKIPIKRTSIRTNRNLVMPQILEEIPEQGPWGRMLLTKFPTFDPSWSDELKLKWFEAFDELLKRVPDRGG
jgi:hypothetical protein